MARYWLVVGVTLLESSCRDLSGIRVDAALGDAAANDAGVQDSGSTRSNGLVAHWEFDDGVGAVALDSSGNLRHGTIVGAGAGATWTSSGASGLGGALNFDNTRAYVSVQPLNFDEISVSLWFYKDTKDSVEDDGLFGGWYHNTNVQQEEGLDLNFEYWDTDGLDYDLTTKNSVGVRTTRDTTYVFADSAGAWHHVVATYERSTGLQNLYVDGILRHSQSHPAGNVIVPLVTYPDMRIGYTRPHGDGYFDGRIDDVRVYNRPLLASEVSDLYGRR